MGVHDGPEYALSSKQRWRLSFLNRPADQRMVSQEAGQVLIAQTRHHDAEPIEKTRQSHDLASLKQALSRLSAEQRFALRLRFEEFLPLKDVAHIMRLDSLHQARRIVEKALEQLRQHMPKNRD